MKKHHWLVALFAVAACQPQSTNRDKTAAVAKKAATDWPSAKEATSAADTLTPAPPPIPVRFSKVLRTDVASHQVSDIQQVREFFRTYNLASLLQTVSGRSGDYVLNGFRGPDQYRTEVVVLAVRRNATKSTSYDLAGLTRTKQKIRHFTGQINFDSLSREPLLTAADRRNIKNWSMVTIVRPASDEPAQRFAVTGQVRLQESIDTLGAGQFEGRLVLELALTKAGHLRTDAPFMHGPSRGGEQRYVGTWTTYQTQQATPAILVQDVWGDALFKQEDFLLGERDAEINPKYAKKGWNTLWANDEWWATSPKPSLNLQANAL